MSDPQSPKGRHGLCSGPAHSPRVTLSPGTARPWDGYVRIADCSKDVITKLREDYGDSLLEQKRKNG